MKVSWTLAVGLILGVLSAGLMYMHITELEQSLASQSFLRLKPDIAVAKGQKILPSMLEPVALPAQFGNLRRVALPASNESSTLLSSGKGVATVDIQAGSFLLYEHIVQSPTATFASMIEPGMRAISIPVNSISAVSYFIGPGAQVDILTTIEITTELVDSEGKTDNSVAAKEYKAQMGLNSPRIVTRTLLQNIKVMAVGRSVSPDNNIDKADTYSTVTFEVTPEQAELLTFALSQAESGLSLVLRNPTNTETIEIPEVSWEELVGVKG